MVGVCTPSSQQEPSTFQREMGGHFSSAHMSKLGSNTSDYLPVIQKCFRRQSRNPKKMWRLLRRHHPIPWLYRTQRSTAESNIEKLLADRKQCHYHLSKQHDPAFVCPAEAGFGTLTPSCRRGRQGGHLAAGSAAVAAWVSRSGSAGPRMQQ